MTDEEEYFAEFCFLVDQYPDFTEYLRSVENRMIELISTTLEEVVEWLTSDYCGAPLYEYEEDGICCVKPLKGCYHIIDGVQDEKWIRRSVIAVPSYMKHGEVFFITDLLYSFRHDADKTVDLLTKVLRKKDS